jgi:ABC-type amino acid transport system permease subunit
MFLYVVATFVLWAFSGALAVAAGLALAVGSRSTRRIWRWLSGAAITLTRGIPTSLLVVAAGLVSIRLTAPPWLPDVFPGTVSAAAPVAWAIVLALAFGSAGHFAVIFRAAHAALGRARLDQSVVLGMPYHRRLPLLAREAATAAIPPTAARLVHHLHNTAFAALFPVADLFGWIENGASATFDITRFVVAGGAGYVALSGLIWAGCKAAEVRLRRLQQPDSAETRPVAVIEGLL